MAFKTKFINDIITFSLVLLLENKSKQSIWNF